MILRGSRYERARPFEGGPFQGVRPRDIGPATGVIEHPVQSGDRLDALAARYYGDPRLYWRILDANPELLIGDRASLEALVGDVLLIPRTDE